MENSQITLSFASISGRKIEADFDGGTTTSDGGALLLRQAESKIGIVDRIVGALCDRRHQSYIDHTYIDLIKQRGFLTRQPATDRVPESLFVLAPRSLAQRRTRRIRDPRLGGLVQQPSLRKTWGGSISLFIPHALIFQSSVREGIRQLGRWSRQGACQAGVRPRRWWLPWWRAPEGRRRRGSGRCRRPGPGASRGLLAHRGRSRSRRPRWL